MTTLDATGITVDLIDTSDRKRIGSPCWTLPMGGGTVRDGGIVVHVRPTVDMATDRWRSYDDTQRLAEAVERGGGFTWVGDEIHVGSEIVAGRDALQLLTDLWKRSREREGDAATAAASYRQGYNAARREALRVLADGVSEIAQP